MKNVIKRKIFVKEFMKLDDQNRLFIIDSSTHFYSYRCHYIINLISVGINNKISNER